MLVDDGTSAVKVAGIGRAAVVLVVVVEGVGRVRDLGVGIEATRAALDSTAVCAVATRVV